MQNSSYTFSGDATRIDEASSTVMYVGQALTGSATSAAVWKIFKIDSSSGLIITWADGNSHYDNVYDDRANLSYS